MPDLTPDGVATREDSSAATDAAQSPTATDVVESSDEPESPVAADGAESPVEPDVAAAEPIEAPSEPSEATEATEATEQAEEQAEPEAPAEPMAEARPLPARPRGDLVALGVAVVVPLVGVVLTLAAKTWLTVAFIMLVPACLVVYGLGLLVLVRVLRRRSALRRDLGAVPLRYRVYAWAWAFAFLLAAVSPMLGGLDMPWALQAALVALSAVGVGALTGAVWSAYTRDVAWAEALTQD